MIPAIKAQLNELQEKQQIKILLAVESGSRAWGFPSPDSDYDVRIIYRRDKDWYLSVADKKDSIDYFHGELLDINGWDIRKTLRLLRKSNATPFEWAQSPIIYEEVDGFRVELLNLAQQFFQPGHTLNHYYGIAKNSYESGLSAGEIKLKKLFYVIRPILAANWILERNSIPPMDIDHLMPIIKEEPTKQRIRELIKIKATANEDYIYAIDASIKNFIEIQLKKIEDTKWAKKSELPDAKVLDAYFRKLLNNF